MTKQLLLIAFCLLSPGLMASEKTAASSLLKGAMEHWRGTTSYLENAMIIHRPDWERAMSMVGWTKGEKVSLLRVTAPAKDAGNATLLKDGNMWSYSPKINRIVKLPSSMMAQSWMGSDFSNKDITRGTEILYAYDHQIVARYEHDGFQVSVIEATPHEDAPVVWGKEVLHIRDDFLLLKQEYWDQEGELVKVMEVLEVQTMSGRTVATVMRMVKAGATDEWTELRIRDIQFDIALPANLFSRSNLRNPRQ